MASDDVFLHYVAQTLVEIPDTRDLSARAGFGADRAAELLRRMAVELRAGGCGDTAKAFQDAASSVGALSAALSQSEDFD